MTPLQVIVAEWQRQRIATSYEDAVYAVDAHFAKRLGLHALAQAYAALDRLQRSEGMLTKAEVIDTVSNLTRWIAGESQDRIRQEDQEIDLPGLIPITVKPS